MQPYKQNTLYYSIIPPAMAITGESTKHLDLKAPSNMFPSYYFPSVYLWSFGYK